jgi:hypothetical protein
MAGAVAVRVLPLLVSVRDCVFVIRLSVERREDHG